MAPTQPSSAAQPDATAKPEVESGPVLPRGTFAARSRARWLDVWGGPDADAGVRWRLWWKNDFHQPVSFLVDGTERDDEENPWLHLQLGARRNVQEGWVRLDDVRVQRVRERIVVDLSSRELVRFRDDRVVARFSVGVGAPEFPTVPGRYFVWAKVFYEPAGVYGTLALGLSGFSNTITDWPGGGRLAIHGTADPGDRGQPVSHGCVRVYSPEMQRLADVAMGTPVIIHS